MSDEQVTTQVLRRRASDQESKQRIVTGWLGIGMAALAFAFGLWRGSEVAQLAGFLGAMVAGNRLPFSAVVGLLPKWGGRE